MWWLFWFGVVWGWAHNLLYIVNGDNQGSGSSWQYPSQDSSLKRQWESWKSHDLIPCNKEKFVSRVKTGLNIGIQCAHHKCINLSNWGCVEERSIRLFQREAEAGWHLEMEHSYICKQSQRQTQEHVLKHSPGLSQGRPQMALLRDGKDMFRNPIPYRV